MTSRLPRGVVEAAAALVVSELVIFVVLGSFVRNGGAYLDDWWLVAYANNPQAAGFSNGLEAVSFYSGGRPMASVLWFGLFDLTGTSFGQARAAALAFGGLAAAAFYVLLRQLRLSPWQAGGVALLALLCPFADAVRFWPTPSLSQLAITAYLLGVLCTLVALGRTGRSGVLMRILGLAFYVVSVLIAEITLVPILASVCLYAVRAPLKRAVRAWALDLVVTVPTALYLQSTLPQRRQTTTDLTNIIDRVQAIAQDALSLFATSLFPFASIDRSIVFAVVALAVVVVVVVNRRDRDALRNLAVFAALAVVGVAAGYAVYALAGPGGPTYLPTDSGPENRVNVVAVLPLAAVIWVALAVVAAALTGGRLGTRRQAVVHGVLIVAVAGSFAHQLRQDGEVWTAAGRQQHGVINAVRATVPQPAPDTALLLFQSPGAVARVDDFGAVRRKTTIAVYSTWWETLGAGYAGFFGNPSTRAFYVSESSRVECARDVAFYIGYDGMMHELPYGRLVFVGTRTRTSATVSSRAECEAAKQSFAPGPYLEELS